MSNNNTYIRSRRLQEAGKSIVGDLSPTNDNYRSSSNYKTNPIQIQEGAPYSQRQKTDFSLDLQNRLKQVNQNEASNGYKNQYTGRNNSNSQRNHYNLHENQSGSFFPPIATVARSSNDKYNQKQIRLTTNETNSLKSECDQYQNLMPCQKQQHRNECNVCKSISPNRSQPGLAGKNYKDKILQEEKQIFQQLEHIRNKMNNNNQIQRKIATPINHDKPRYKENGQATQALRLASLEQQPPFLNQNQQNSRKDYQNTVISDILKQNSTSKANSNYEWGMKGFSQASSPNRILSSLNTLPVSPVATNQNHNRYYSSAQTQNETVPFSKTVYPNHKNGSANLNDSQTNLGYNVHYKTTYQPQNYNHNKVTQFENPVTNTSIDNLKGTLKKRRPSIQKNSISIQTSMQDTFKKNNNMSYSHQNIKPSIHGASYTGIDVQKIKSSRQNCINLLDNLKKLVSNKKNLSYTAQDFFKPQ
ncbi:hypothetical protein ABPG74_008613 [Tetrahymena malaccensis]